MNRIQKPESNLRLPLMLQLAAKAPHCMVGSCEAHNVGQVVGAHSNHQSHGKGMGLKADDLVAFMCESCHDKYDGRAPGWDALQKEQAWNGAFFRTVRWLFTSGHAILFKTAIPDKRQ